MLSPFLYSLHQQYNKGYFIIPILQTSNLPMVTKLVIVRVSTGAQKIVTQILNIPFYLWKVPPGIMKKVPN